MPLPDFSYMPKSNVFTVNRLLKREMNRKVVEINLVNSGTNAERLQSPCQTVYTPCGKMICSMNFN
jgi:hypothetical protein